MTQRGHVSEETAKYICDTLEMSAEDENEAGEGKAKLKAGDDSLQDKKTTMRSAADKPPNERRLTWKTAADQKDWYDGVQGNEEYNEGATEEDRATWWFPSNPPGYDRMSWFRWFFLLFEHPDKCRMSTYISAFIFLLIFVSSLSSWIETIPSFRYPVRQKGLINKDYRDSSTGPQTKTTNLGRCPGPDCQLITFITINQICMSCFLAEYIIRAIAVWGMDVSPWYDVEILWQQVQLKGKRGVLLFYEPGAKGTTKENVNKPRWVNADDNPYLHLYHADHNKVFPNDYGGKYADEATKALRGTVPPRMSGCKKWWNWTWKALSLVDLVSVLPFILDILGASKHMQGMVALRYLRLVRVFRVMKLQKQTIAVALFVNTVVLSAGPLIVLLFFTALMIVVFGAVVYQVEKGNYCPGAYPVPDQVLKGTMINGVTTLALHDAPNCYDENNWPTGTAAYTAAKKTAMYNKAEKWGNCTLPALSCVVSGKLLGTCCGEGDGCFCRLDLMGDNADSTPFYSTFMSMWWVLTTITTVGYGDTYPTSLVGRLCGALSMVLGVVGFSMPISIIGNSFEEEYRRLSANTGAIDKAMGVKDISKPEEEMLGHEMFKACVMAVMRQQFSPDALGGYARKVANEDAQKPKQNDIPMQI